MNASVRVRHSRCTVYANLFRFDQRFLRAHFTGAAGLAGEWSGDRDTRTLVTTNLRTNTHTHTHIYTTTIWTLSVQYPQLVHSIA